MLQDHLSLQDALGSLFQKGVLSWGGRALTLAKIISFPGPHKEVKKSQGQLSLGSLWSNFCSIH